VGVFYPWDWVYFQALSSFARAETWQKPGRNLCKQSKQFREIVVQNITKILIGEAKVQDPLPTVPGHE
jgi:hypothetical protein